MSFYDFPTLSNALAADPSDGSLVEFDEEYLMLIHGGSSSTGYTGLAVPAPVAVAVHQIGEASETVVHYAETAIFYGRHAAAEAIEFVADPLDYVISRAADAVRPDGPAPSRN